MKSNFPPGILMKRQNLLRVYLLQDKSAHEVLFFTTLNIFPLKGNIQNKETK